MGDIHWRAAILGASALLVASCTSFSGAIHYGRGSDALEEGDAGAAIVHLERAAELVPEASEVQNHLGIAYQAAGRKNDALAAYERAVALDCDNAAAQHNLEALRARLLPEMSRAAGTDRDPDQRPAKASGDE